MKNYKEFTISSVPFNIDIISGALWQLEILGINEYDDHLKVFVYDDSKVDEKQIALVFSKLKSEKLIQSYHISEETLISKNWNEEWEKKIMLLFMNFVILRR